MFATDINSSPAAATIDARTQVYIDRINVGRETYGTINPPRLQLPAGRIPTIQDIDRAFDQLRNPPDGSIFIPPSIAAKGQDSVWAYVANQQYQRQHRDGTLEHGQDDDVVDAEFVDE
jgi:hypothetical protein